jgi:hypothetical protein
MLRHMAAEIRRKEEAERANGKEGVVGGTDTKQEGDACCVLALHPGEVATDMADVELDWEVEGIIQPDESVQEMLKVIESKGPRDSGTFWCWDGRVSALALHFLSFTPFCCCCLVASGSEADERYSPTRGDTMDAGGRDGTPVLAAYRQSGLICASSGCSFGAWKGSIPSMLDVCRSRMGGPWIGTLLGRSIENGRGFEKTGNISHQYQWAPPSSQPSPHHRYHPRHPSSASPTPSSPSATSPSMPHTPHPQYTSASTP